MITSSSISYISKVLDQPQDITEADSESIEQLTKEFPYFVPARYLDAARRHKEMPFSDDMMSSMQLYMGNWLNYCHFLQDSAGGVIADFTPETETQIETPSEEVNVASEPQEKHPVVETTEVLIAEEPVIETPEQVVQIEEEPIIEVTEETKAPIVEQAIAAAEATNEKLAELAEEAAVQEEPEETETPLDGKKENLIPPVYTEDYFLHQGVQVSNNIPADIPRRKDDETSLMVVMSFSEWLSHYKRKKKQEEEEENDQRELKTMWQKEKLAAALEEGNDEIPETVFEMAVNSISKEENLASESLAEVYVKQERYDKAIDMYKKLSLSKPQKKAYFARRIEEILNLSNS